MSSFFVFFYLYSWPFSLGLVPILLLRLLQARWKGRRVEDRIVDDEVGVAIFLLVVVLFLAAAAKGFGTFTQLMSKASRTPTGVSLNERIGTEKTLVSYDWNNTSSCMSLHLGGGGRDGRYNLRQNLQSHAYIYLCTCERALTYACKPNEGRTHS